MLLLAATLAVAAVVYGQASHDSTRRAKWLHCHQQIARHPDGYPDLDRASEVCDLQWPEQAERHR